MGCCQAGSPSSSSSWTLSLHVSFLFVQCLQTAFYDRGGSVKGEVTWKYLSAAVLQRGQLWGRCAAAVFTTSAFLSVAVYKACHLLHKFISKLHELITLQPPVHCFARKSLEMPLYSVVSRDRTSAAPQR